MSLQLRPGDPEEAGMDPARVRLIAQRAAEWVEQGITPALVVLVARRGIVVLHEAYGRLTPEPDSPPLPRDAIFPLSSITKPMTATAAMILVEDGLLGLNRPVCEYLPEFTGAGKQAVMVYHLLTHTSGLRDEDVEAYAVGNGAAPIITESGCILHVADYLRVRYDAPLWQPPGVEMSYCLLGYELLGEIIARVSGQPLAVLAQERIFGPLGMQDTFYVVPEAVRQRVVRRPAEAVAADLLNSLDLQELPYASGGVYGTARDLAAFGQMFLNRGGYGDARVLSPATVAEMTRNQIPGISARYGAEYFPEASWGLGWDVQGHKKAVRDASLGSAQTVTHDGLGGTLLWIDPAAGLVCVYLSVVQREGEYHDKDWYADLFINAVTAAVA